MKIYLANILLLFVYGAVFLKDASKRKNAVFCSLASLNWILLSGLRHLTVGADTIKYGYMFEQAKSISWVTLWNDRTDIFINKTLGKDPGYIVFQKLVQLFTSSYRTWLIIAAVLFIVPLGVFIYKHSANSLISFLIYSCMFYSFFSITGTRQTLVTAIAVFAGYKYIKERCLLKFLLLILIASFIHFSVVFFIPAYFIVNMKITNKYLYLCGCTFVAVLAFKEAIFRLVSSISGYGQYQPFEGAATWNFSILLIALTVVALLKRKEILSNNPQAKHYINALLTAVILVPFTFVNPSVMRVVQYYSLFIILLVPEIINSFKKQERFFVYFVACSALILLLIKNNPVYIFFWQS